MACLVQNTSVDSSKSGSWSPLYGGTRLDQDTIQYIHKFYCKDCRMEAERAKAAAEGGMVGEEAVEIKQEPSSPHNSFEDMSLQRSMDKNKESLKRKLMMRRSLIELVDQGIYPPPKTPPAFAEQRKLLERAKTGDLLRHKIQHRPDRQLLVQQHILEDTKIDPSLHERQRQLKRARLADNLNDKLLHRPGVLELVEGNILPDENLLEAIKDGSLTFNKSVDQGDEDSQSLYTVMEDGSKSCDESPSSDQNEDSNMSDISSPPIPPPPLPFHDLSLVFSKPSQPQVQQFTFHTKIPGPSANLSLVASTVQKNTPVSAFSGTGNSLSPKSVTSVSSNSNNGNNKSRQKKLKPKTQPKAKVIKFHEYKGPPNVVKTQQIIQQNNAQETPYHVLLQQQQLFLQWQLEFQQKNMNNINVPILVPAQNVVSPEGQQGPQFVSSSPASTATNVAVTSVASVTTAPITITTQNGPQTVISVAASQPAAPTPATVIKASKFQHHIKLESLQNQMTTSVKPELMLVAQPQPQLPASGIQNPLPISQPGPRCTSSNKSQNKKTSNTSSTPSKPITSLEDMKVADLRAELKKRNLPVSGPKPQLIERLKPYTDVIIQASQNYALSYSTHSVTSPASGHTSQDSVMSPTSTVYSPPGSVAPNEDIMGSNAVSPLAPIHSITSVVSMPSVMSPEDPKSVSPPTTPEFHNILTPMSPDMMDIPSPSNATMGQHTKSQQLNASQNSIAMNISRPPSVMADAPMEVDSSELFLNVSQSNQVLTTPTTIKFLQSHHAQTQPLQLQQQQQRPLVQVVQPQPQQQQVQISQCQLSQEELLKQQQQKIEELQRQLEESQLRLKLQLLQHQHMQQQQQNLQQLQQQQQQIQQIQQQQAQLQQLAAQQQQAVLSKPVQLKQPNSPPQVIINVTNSKTVSPQHQQISPPAPHPPPPPPPPLPSQPQVGLSSTKSIHIPAQLLQAVQTTHGLPAVIVTSTKSDPDKKKPNLSKNFKNQSINQNIKLGGRMVSVASAPAELHQFILTTTSTPISSSGQAPINGIITPARMSLPGSPVDDGKQPLGKSQSNPFFIPLKEPPKYDEAIKRRQQHQGATSTVQESTKTQPATHTMDDVLEILIRSGELPPSAAQEPPPTPKTTVQTEPVSTITITQAGTMPVENCMSSAGTLQLVTAFSTAAINDSNAGQNLTSVQEQVSSNPQTFKQEPLSPPSFTEPASSPPPVETNTDFLDINDMLGQDLNSMDWTSDPAFSGLDITDTSCMTTDFDFKQHFINERSLLEFPTSQLSSSMKSFYGSEPDLTALGLSDTGENSNMQIDVPDWFDVIMPSTGMTPLTGNAPVSFPSDPILTPRTHQEVLDLFSFDDTDLSTPSELSYGTNWDKITEGTASSTS
ncbi:hypothetical protein ACJMK2_034410 [Sinanodonta woodiana]|uniref:SAP domain-containing protein n=1 Tax=Sinanodonta woodiana TaxID=1069815 RepID=A0ABD3WRG5_SINWO